MAEMSTPACKRPLGRTGLRLGPLGFGGGPLGGLLRATPEADGRAAVAAARDLGIDYFDTAPWYGLGLSERRLGDALREDGRDGVVLSTKVGRLLRRPGPGRMPTASQFQGALPFEVAFDYGYDGVMRSFEDSLQRFGRDRIDILYVHDVNAKYHGGDVPARVREVMAGGHRALARLRSEGAIRAFGAGIDDLAVLTTLAREGDFDCFMMAGRMTLLDQSAAGAFLPLCRSRGVGIVVASPFESGILATGATPAATFGYRAAPPEILDKVARIEAVCRGHGVPLAAAALRFPLRHPAIACVVAGMRAPDEVRTNAAHAAAPVPDALWDELEAQGLVAALPDAA